MKYFLHSMAITLCLALTVTSLQAQVISAHRAQEIANSFFQCGMQKSTAVRSTAVAGLTTSFDSNILTTECGSEAPTFHILTPASGKGFVIVSGEEIENPIIGYSFDATIDANDLPVGFVDYMTDIDAQIKALREQNTLNPEKIAAARSAMQKTNYAATMGNVIVNLNTAPWGQRVPFNNLCKTTAGDAAATGCVPTAYAIIAHYHQWPASATETKVTHTGTNESITLGHEYDWENILSSYSGTYNDAEATAVATLMRDLGWAYGVSYGTGSTQSGSGGEGPTTFMNVFKYSCNTPLNHGSYATVRETLANDVLWVQYIKESLDANLPIPYSSTGDGGRHIFVLDGYTDNGYYHFNWGWNGQGNGWFTLDAMTPDTESDYSKSHRAYFMLTPNKASYTVNASVSPESAGTVSINGGTAANTATGLYTEGTNVTLTAAANTGYTFSHWSKDGTSYSTSKSCTAKVAQSNNDYVANFLTVGNTTVDIQVTYNSSYGTVTYNGNTVSGTGITPYLNSEITLTATPLAGYVFNGWTVTKGTESETHSTAELTLVATGDMTIEAIFAKAATEYTIDASTTGLEDGEIATELNYITTINNPVALSLSTDNGKITKSTTGFRLYAYVTKTPVTYTLSVPDGYTITGYSFDYSLNSITYPCTITYNNGSEIKPSPADIEWYTLETTVNAQTADFTLTAEKEHASSYFFVKNFIVTIMATEDAGSGETPTTFTVNVNAGEGGTVTPASQSVAQGGTVTLTAIPSSGYTFVNWTNDLNADVVTDNPYTTTVTADITYTANFQAAPVIANSNIPSDNTLRYYRLAIAIGLDAYTEDFNSDYNSVEQFWQDCEDFMNEMYVPLGMCFDVVVNEGLLMAEELSVNTQDIPEIGNVTTLIDDAIGTTSYDVGIWIAHRDATAENTGLSAGNGAYSSTLKANSYAKADKWVVAHEVGHLFGADHTTQGEGSLMDNTGEFFSYPSIKKIRTAAVTNGTSNAYKTAAVTNNAPGFTAQMKDTYIIPQGACLSIPVYAGDADSHSLTYTAIGCSSSNVENVVEGGTVPHFASFKPQTSSVIEYSPKFTADINYASDFYTVDGTDIPSMDAGSYSIALLVNDVPAENSYEYLTANPFYSNYAVWDATVEIVAGTLFTASISPAQESYTGGSSVTVNWGVNENYFTQESRVRITMSTDYGKTFSYVLAESIPALDGNCSITLPNVTVGDVDVDFSTATRSMRGGIIRIEEIDGAAFTLTTLTPENGGGFYISGSALTTYTVNVNAGEGGTVTPASQSVAQGGTVTLTATPDNGYRFVNWTNNLNTDVVTDNPYTATVTADITYTANFEAEEPVADPLDGKYFRLKTLRSNEYMNILDYEDHDGAYGGVNVASKETNNNNQIFYFIGSGSNYKLKSLAGYYIYNDFSTPGYWNVNANSTSDNNCMLLSFEPTGEEFQYLISCTKGYFMSGPVAQGGGGNGSNYVYCDVASTSADTWLLEEVTLCSVTATAGEGGTATSETTTVESGTSVKLTATPNDGYTFANWTNNLNEDVITENPYTATVTADITYTANFKEIAGIEDGKAYRIKGRMSDGTYRYIYRNGTQIMWKNTADDTDNSIFIAQYDFAANDGSLNLISAVGDYGWQYGGTLGNDYIALKITTGTADGTFTLYNEETVATGTNYRSYTAYSSTATATSDNINYYTNTTLQKVADTNGTTDFIFEEAAFEFGVKTANGSNAKLGTINLPFATTVHPSITVYRAMSSDEGYVYVTPLTLTGNVLPANTPVLVEADEAGTYGFAPALASNEKYETGFAGTLAAEDIPTTVNAYILSYDGAGTDIKFYKLSSNATNRTIKANKAYYIDETGIAATLSFKFIGTTEVYEVKGENGDVEIIYDLRGRKLNEITEPGIYIIDGKKVFIK